MQTPTSLKAGAAFLAGVVIALGGAFAYFKVADSHARADAEFAPAGHVASSVPDMTASSPAAQDTPAPAASEPPRPATTVTEKQSVAPIIPKPKVLASKPRITSRPVSLAVVTPKNEVLPEVVSQVIPQTSQTMAPLSPPLPAGPLTQVTLPPAEAPPRQPHTVTIPAGTNLAIRLNEKLSTDHNYMGDTFRASLDTPIVMEGFIIADRGAKVLGRVSKARKPGKFEGMAELSLTLTEISTTDGQRLHVQTNESIRKGPSNTNEEVLKMGGGAALGAIIGAIAGGGKGAAIGAGAGGAAGTGAVLLGHGKPAVIDNETRLTFTVTNPTTITEQLN